jgi:hypothetical protein
VDVLPEMMILDVDVLSSGSHLWKTHQLESTGVFFESLAE